MKNKTNLEIGEEMHKRNFLGFPVERLGDKEFTNLWDAAAKINKSGLCGDVSFEAVFQSWSGKRELRAVVRCHCGSKSHNQKCNSAIVVLGSDYAPAFYFVWMTMFKWMHADGCTCVSEPNLIELQRLFGDGQDEKKPDYKRIDVHDGKCIHDVSVNEPCEWCEKNIPF